MIRPALLVDVPEILELGRRLVTTSPSFGGLNFCRDKVFVFLTSLLVDPNGILLVYERESKIRGALAGAIMEHTFSLDRYATDFGLFVEPGNGFGAARLIQAFEVEVRKRGITDLRPGVMTGVHASRTQKLYERLGYQTVGAQFLKR